MQIQAGIVIKCVGDGSHPIALYRSDDGGSTYALRATLSPYGPQYTDPLPLDGVVRYYKARLEYTGFLPGPWGGPVSSAPYPIAPGGGGNL